MTKPLTATITWKYTKIKILSKWEKHKSGLNTCIFKNNLLKIDSINTIYLIFAFKIIFHS